MNGGLVGAVVGVMNVGERVGEKTARVGLHRPNGARSAQVSGWRESVIQRSQYRQKRCGGRGTGAVMATGSYEESLTTEGIPGHLQLSAVTRRQ